MWNFHLKRIYAEFILKRKYEKNKRENEIEELGKNEAPKLLKDDTSFDYQMIFGNDPDGNSLFLKYERRPHDKAEIWLILSLKNGEVFTFPTHPNTLVVNVNSELFEGAGLKMERLIPHRKWRITYSGWLRQGMSDDKSDRNLRYVKINFL